MAETRILHDLMRAKAGLRCICRRCRHGALLFAMTLGEEHGWDRPLAEITRCPRCSKCQSSHVDAYEAAR